MLPEALATLPAIQDAVPRVRRDGRGVGLLLVGGALFSSSQSNIFWMAFRLSALFLLLCYLLGFPAFLVFRKRHPDHPRPYRLPGGHGTATVAAWACTLYIFGACVIFFAPSPTSEAPLKEALVLGAETLVTVVVGWLLIPRRARSRRTI